MTRARCALVLAGCLAVLADCGNSSGPPKAPCATNIVATYTAKMIAAGCTGKHFSDPQCAPIKAERDAKEKEAGCLQ